MPRNDGGAAFPVPGSQYSGMSLRDWMAGMVMQGNLAGRAPMVQGQTALAEVDWPAQATLAYKVADAMLEARKAKGHES